METTRPQGGWHAKDTGGPGAHGGRQGGARARGEDRDRAGAAGGARMPLRMPTAAASRGWSARWGRTPTRWRSACEGTARAALSDAARSGRPASIGTGDRAWVAGLACLGPCELGHPAETRAQSALAARAPTGCATAAGGATPTPGEDARGARRLPTALVPPRRGRRPAALGGRGARHPGDRARRRHRPAGRHGRGRRARAPREPRARRAAGVLDARYPEGHAMRLVPGDRPARRPGETRA